MEANLSGNIFDEIKFLVFDRLLNPKLKVLKKIDTEDAFKMLVDQNSEEKDKKGIIRGQKKMTLVG